MLFNSIQFAIFFPIVTIIYFMLPYKYRWVLLLSASCIFYMFFIPKYILILFLTIIIDYNAAIWIANSSGKTKKLILWISILSTCLVLFIFKYVNFFSNNFRLIAAFFHWNYPIGIINIILPIGLSFHTFQSLSYVIEVYRGHQKVEKHFGIYALYVMFYPQLVAGPIERPQNLLHQFREKFDFEYSRVTNGLKLMCWGLFKKVVIADRLAIVVNRIYGSPDDYTGLSLIIATLFFAFQIYCDFSGYSDIAIGSAQVMGFKLMDNFKRPYFAKSISEFWKRWHISLSSWFKDYLYIPLGGNRVAKWRWQLNLFITFTVSGLWHGANWTYIIWGALNGFYLVFALWTDEIRYKISTLLRMSKYPIIFKYWRVATTFALVCFAWIFFRAKNLSDAWYVITHIFVWGHYDSSLLTYIKNILSNLGLDKINLFIAFFSILFLLAVHLLQRHYKIRHMLSEQPLWIRWPIYNAIILMILFWGVIGQNNFIYFQF